MGAYEARLPVPQGQDIRRVAGRVKGGKACRSTANILLRVRSAPKRDDLRHSTPRN